MAGTAASGNAGSFNVAAVRKGDIGNRILLKVIADPAGTTGATTVSVAKSAAGPTITVKCKNTAGTISATKGEIYSAMSGSADAQGLVTVTTGAATGADTGAAFTGSGGAFVALAGGAEGTTTVTYDDLAAATGDTGVAPKLINALGVDTFVYQRGDGTELRASAVAGTGATAAVLALGRDIARRSQNGEIGASGLRGA